MEGGRETRQGRGDGRSLGTEQLPISQLPLLNTGITEEAKSGNIHRCGSIFPHPPLSLLQPCFLHSSLWFLFFLASCLSLILSVDLFFIDSPDSPPSDAPRCVFYPFYQLASPSLPCVVKEQKHARD